MNCNFFVPSGEKTRTVDKYFYLSDNAEKADSKSLIVPDCTSGIVYVHTGSISRAGDTFSANDCFIFGQKTKAVEYQFGTDTQAFGCKLSPSALFHLFGISAHEMTDTFVTLDLVLDGIDEFKEHLMQGKVSPALCTNESQEEVLEAILHHIHQSKGLLRIKSVCLHFNMGYRKLERLFKKHVGITPKLYARIVWFNHSLKISTNHTTLTELAYEAGFFDQNHFIKEIKGFTQKAPSELFGGKETDYRMAHVNYLKARSY